MLRGRQAECAAIDALLGRSRRAEADVLVFRGEPGIGKTALLEEAAEQSPLLVLIDDAHWLDRASSDAWMFAARRLAGEAVGVLIAARNEPGAPDAAGLPELKLVGLAADQAALLLDDLGVTGVARTDLV